MRPEAANVPQRVEFHTAAHEWSGGSRPPTTQADVRDPLPDKVLYGPRGEVISRLRQRNPIGFHDR